MINVFLTLILIICVITDIRSRKIYNKVIFPSLLAAFVYHFASGGWEGLSSSFIGFLIGLGLLLIPYMMRGIGAGDVKLVALIGALKGGSFVFEAFLYIAIIGGIIALGIVLFRSGVLKSIIYFLYAFKNGVRNKAILSKGSLKTVYPYGVAIAAGTFLRLLAERWPIL